MKITIKGTNIRPQIQKVNNFVSFIDRSFSESMSALGDDIVKETKALITNGDSSWATLSKPHIRYKKRKGYREPIYQMTGTMYNNVIKEFRFNKGSNSKLKVGFPDIMNPDKNRSIAKIAKDLENGTYTTNGHKRPLLSKTVVTVTSKYPNAKYNVFSLIRKRLKK